MALYVHVMMSKRLTEDRNDYDQQGSLAKALSLPCLGIAITPSEAVSLPLGIPCRFCEPPLQLLYHPDKAKAVIPVA